MTLDETIKEFTNWAKGNRKEQNFWAAERDENDETNPLSYADCEGLARDAETRAEYHEQLAEWLTELKELRNSIGAVKLSNMKEALALIRTLKAELNGWQEDPFSIIAEVCGAVTDCRRCQWYEKCPLLKNCGGWKLQQGGRTDEHP